MNPIQTALKSRTFRGTLWNISPGCAEITRREPRSNRSAPEDQEVQIDAQPQIAKAKGEVKGTVVKAKATAAAYKIKSEATTPQILQLQAIWQRNGFPPTYPGSGVSVPFLSTGKEAVASK